MRSYNETMSCLKSLRLCMVLLQSLRSELLKPSDVTIGTCLKACVEGVAWRDALHLQAALRQGVSSYSAIGDG